jgi:ribosomal protein S18 acetylase RimI-like enzyme
MELRILKPSDANNYRYIRLEALQNNPEAFASSYEEEKDEPVEKYIYNFQSKDSFTIGAFENGNLVGVITLKKESLLKLRHRANIVAMYVNPESRGIGIGKALLTEVIKKANDLDGIEQIYLTVVTTNEAAKRLYYSMGFEVFGTEKKALKWDNKYFDEDHMVIFL